MDFNILRQPVKVSESVLQSELLVRRYDDLAQVMLSDFDKLFASLMNDRTQAPQLAMQFASDTLGKVAKDFADLCVSNEIFEHNQDTIMQVYNDLGCGSGIVALIDSLDQRIDAVHMRESQNDEHRRMRSDGRFKLAGGGFGLGGAAAGIAEAAAVNTVTGLAHGAVNIGGKLVSSVRAHGDIKDIVQEAKAPLREAIHAAIGNFYIVHVEVLGRHGFCLADTFPERQARLARAAVMFGHLQQGSLTPDRQILLALNCLALAPGQIPYHVVLAGYSLLGETPSADISELARLATAVQLDPQPIAAAAYDLYYRQTVGAGDRRAVSNRLRAAAEALGYDNSGHACAALAAEFTQAAVKSGPHGLRDRADELSAMLLDGSDILPITLEGVRHSLLQDHRPALRKLAKDVVIDALDGDERYAAAFRTTAFIAIMDAFYKKDISSLFGGKMESVRSDLLDGKMAREKALILSELLLILAPFCYDNPTTVQEEIRRRNADVEARNSDENSRLGAAIAEALAVVPLDVIAVGDRIPHTKLKNARSAFPLPGDSLILALLDDTFFSNNENGIAFTATGLIWRNSWSKMPAPGLMTWDSFLQAEISVGKKMVMLGEVSVPITKAPVDRVAAFLKALQDCLRGNTSKPYERSGIVAPDVPPGTTRKSAITAREQPPNLVPPSRTVAASDSAPASSRRQPWSTFLWSFEGRISRREYWVRFGLAALGILFGCLYIDGITGLGFVTLLMLFPVTWSALAVGAKRCHDLNKSGWFQLINLIPLIGSLWLLVTIGFRSGTPGPNRFGPDPRGTG